MLPSLFNRRSCSRTARALALVALLCVVGVQVLEAGHLHNLGDGSAECLLCKSSPLLATVAAATLLLLALAGAERPGHSRLAALATRRHSRRARGPPFHS
jgi:hypothetical protein